MTREKFYELFGKPKDVRYVETEKFKEVVFVRFIYNTMLNLERPSLQNAPASYVLEMSSIWSRAFADQVNREDKEFIEEGIEKSRFTKEMLKRGYEVEARVRRVPQLTVDGDLHGIKVYVEFEFDVEGLLLDWGRRYKRKYYIFVKDGVFEFKFPSYSLNDNSSPYFFMGFEVLDKTGVWVY